MFNKYLPTYMLSSRISDISGNLYISFPRELAEPILGGMKAEDFEQIKDDPESLKKTICQCIFSSHQLLVKSITDS